MSSIKCPGLLPDIVHTVLRALLQSAAFEQWLRMPDNGHNESAGKTLLGGVDQPRA